MSLQQLVQDLIADTVGVLIAATDEDIAVCRQPGRLEDMAAKAGVRFNTVLPPERLNDWNDVLCALSPVS